MFAFDSSTSEIACEGSRRSPTVKLGREVMQVPTFMIVTLGGPVLSPSQEQVSATPFGKTKTVLMVPYAVSYVPTTSELEALSRHTNRGGVSGLPGGTPAPMDRPMIPCLLRIGRVALHQV